MHDYLSREVGMVGGGSGKVERGDWKFMSERALCCERRGLDFFYLRQCKREKRVVEGEEDR